MFCKISTISFTVNIVISDVVMLRLPLSKEKKVIREKEKGREVKTKWRGRDGGRTR